MLNAEDGVPQNGEAPNASIVKTFYTFLNIVINFFRKIGVRHYQYILYGLTFTVFYGIYSSISMAIVPMTSEYSSEVDVPEHVEWTNPDTILSAFFWAYFIPHVTGAKLCEKVKPKWILLFSMLIGSVFNIGIPAMAEIYGSKGVVGCRVIQGLCQGFLYPALTALINVWSPACERSKVMNTVIACSILGTAICMPLAGLMAGTGKGWVNVFYGFGVVGIVWAIIFALLSKHSPAKHKRITEEERAYIERRSTDEEDRIDQDASKKVPTPWVDIVKSKPVWAILAAGSAQCWGGNTLLTQMPTYMSNMMNYDITNDGDMAGVPYFVQLGISLMVIPLTEYFISKKTKNTTILRKIFTSLGSFIPAVALIALAFVDGSQRQAGIALLSLAIGTSAFSQSGYLINVVELAPNHAPALFSLLNSVTTISSTLGPLTVGFLGPDKKDASLWRNVFLIAASIYVACGIFYCVFASADMEAWNWVDKNAVGIGTKIKNFFKKYYDSIKKKVTLPLCCRKRMKCPSFCETTRSKIVSWYEDNQFSTFC